MSEAPQPPVVLRTGLFLLSLITMWTAFVKRDLLL